MTDDNSKQPPTLSRRGFLGASAGVIAALAMRSTTAKSEPSTPTSPEQDNIRERILKLIHEDGIFPVIACEKDPSSLDSGIDISPSAAKAAYFNGETRPLAVECHKKRNTNYFDEKKYYDRLSDPELTESVKNILLKNPPPKDRTAKWKDGPTFTLVRVPQGSVSFAIEKTRATAKDGKSVAVYNTIITPKDGHPINAGRGDVELFVAEKNVPTVITFDEIHNIPAKPQMPFGLSYREEQLYHLPPYEVTSSLRIFSQTENIVLDLTKIAGTETKKLLGKGATENTGTDVDYVIDQISHNAYNHEDYTFKQLHAKSAGEAGTRVEMTLTIKLNAREIGKLSQDEFRTLLINLVQKAELPRNSFSVARTRLPVEFQFRGVEGDNIVPPISIPGGSPWTVADTFEGKNGEGETSKLQDWIEENFATLQQYAKEAPVDRDNSKRGGYSR